MLLVIQAVKYSALGLMQILLAASCFPSSTAKPCGKISLGSNKLRESEVKPPRQLKCQIKPLATFSSVFYQTSHPFIFHIRNGQPVFLSRNPLKTAFSSRQCNLSSYSGKTCKPTFPLQLSSPCLYILSNTIINSGLSSVTKSAQEKVFSTSGCNVCSNSCSQFPPTYLMNQFPHGFALSDSRQTCKLEPHTGCQPAVSPFQMHAKNNPQLQKNCHKKC